ncbi:alpha/beta hydrolase [Verrucomicrobia bacterium]|jgi:acetyl esterase/lipase|nr:alpha/beta hydrolase [Verrucomicrobiota bacterium]MDA7657616.1 alpha/beta hydrolase [Verrucomicrobiota bacterium]
MHHRIIFAVLLCFVLCCHGDVTTLTDIEFAKPEGHSLKLDLYLPSSSSEASPVVVFIHGGGWKNGSKDRAKKLAGWLVESGFAVAGISYRLTDVAGWPAQINDCYTAIRWLRENAQEYSLDSMNIGVWGTSAGGHLAVLLGTRPFSGEETVSSRVQAVCDWFGPSDLLSMPPNNLGDGRTEEDVANSNGAKLLRATVREVPERANDASGLFHVSSDDPSFLIMHGELDPGVPLSQSRRLDQALTKANVSSDFHIVPGAGHGGKGFDTPEIRETVLAFFQKTLINR